MDSPPATAEVLWPAPTSAVEGEAILEDVRDIIKDSIASHTLNHMAMAINGPPGFSDWMEERMKQAIALDIERETECLKLRKKDLQLSEIRLCLDKYTKCGKCWRLMEAPFTLECGHSFCVSCLRVAFRNILGRRLTLFANTMNLDLPLFQIIPSSQQQLDDVILLLQEYGATPRSFLTYSCLDPECDSIVSRVPFPSYEYRSLVIAMKDALAKAENGSGVVNGDDASMDPWAAGHEGCFGGLFIENK